MDNPEKNKTINKDLFINPIDFSNLSLMSSAKENITISDTSISAKSYNLNPLDSVTTSTFDYMTIPNINVSAKPFNLSSFDSVTTSAFDYMTIPSINISAKSYNLSPFDSVTTSAFDYMTIPNINISAKPFNHSLLNSTTSIINNITKPDTFSNSLFSLNTPNTLDNSFLSVLPDISNIELLSVVEPFVKNIDSLKQNWLNTTLTTQFKQNNITDIQKKVKQSTSIINNSYLANPNFSSLVISTYKKNNNLKKDNIIEKLAFKGVHQLFSDISEVEISDFFQYLSEYPMLGLAHKIGKKIYESIQNMNPVQAEENLTLYHGRKREKSQSLPYVLEDLLQAPYGIPYQGRFNPAGINLFYTSTSSKVVTKELNITKTDKIDILKFNFKNTFNILDLTKVSDPLITFCMQPSNNLNIDKSYLIPNFISQCAFSNSEIHAIKFNSIPDPKESNFIFFGISRNDINKGYTVI